MMTVHLYTLSLVFMLIVGLAITKLVISKLLNATSTPIKYETSKFIYHIKQTQLSKKFAIEYIENSFIFILSLLPVLYYFNSTDGYNLDYLLSSMKESEFLLVWFVVCGLYFFMGDIKTSDNFNFSITSILSIFTHLILIYLILMKKSDLGFVSFDLVQSLITFIVLLSLILSTRSLFRKKIMKNQQTISNKQFCKINSEIFKFSICLVTSVTIMSIMNVHIQSNLLKYLEYIVAYVVYFLFKIEESLWRNVTMKQENYLFNKYQKNIQLGIIVGLCLLFYFY